MIFPVVAVKTIAELAFTAIPLVERLIRGPKRGDEKKQAARDFILEELQNVAKNNIEALPDFGNFDWKDAIGDFTTLAAKVDAVIDAVVDLMNTLSKYNRTSNGPVSAARIQTP